MVVDMIMLLNPVLIRGLSVIASVVVVVVMMLMIAFMRVKVGMPVIVITGVVSVMMMLMLLIVRVPMMVIVSATAARLMIMTAAAGFAIAMDKIESSEKDHPDPREQGVDPEIGVEVLFDSPGGVKVEKQAPPGEEGEDGENLEKLFHDRRKGQGFND